MTNKGGNDRPHELIGQRFLALAPPPFITQDPKQEGACPTYTTRSTTFPQPN